MSKVVFFLLTLAMSCSMMETPVKPHAPKEFSKGEIILGTQLLAKVYDQEMAPLKCVPDVEEASLLLRTIHPRYEVVQDDYEALLDTKSEVSKLIAECDQNCTCGFIDDLLREHQVILDKNQRKLLNEKKQEKDLNSCLSYIQSTFCESDLYKELNKEKVDFTFEE
jgi:hypothetical protein